MEWPKTLEALTFGVCFFGDRFGDRFFFKQKSVVVFFKIFCLFKSFGEFFGVMKQKISRLLALAIGPRPETLGILPLPKNTSGFNVSLEGMDLPETLKSLKFGSQCFGTGDCLDKFSSHFPGVAFWEFF